MWSKFLAIDYDPLPLAVPHNTYEPATSLISRLAARNGVGSTLEFCQDVRFPYPDLIAGRDNALALLSQLAGCNEAVLKDASIRNLGRNSFRLRNEVATTQSLQRSKVRICPKCVQGDLSGTDEYWRAWRRI